MKCLSLKNNRIIIIIFIIFINCSIGKNYNLKIKYLLVSVTKLLKLNFLNVIWRQYTSLGYGLIAIIYNVLLISAMMSFV